MATADGDGGGGGDPEPERYAHIHPDDGAQCVIYDRENESAWVQSTMSIPVAELD